MLSLNALSSSLGIPPALASAASGYLANALGMQGAGKATLTNLGTSLISNLLSGSTSGSSAPFGSSGAASGASGIGGLGGTQSGIGGLGGTQTGTASAIPWMQAQKPTMLTIGSREKPSQEASLKQIYQGLDPALAQYYAERGISVPGISAASGGTVDSSIGNELDRKYSPNFKIYSPTILNNRGLGQIPGSTMQPLKMLRQSIHGAAKGGLPRQYKDASPEGHNPEFITGLTGFYADGGGTGQSDDIPALLHDGDYVMDAETVSALGDGSSKAGRHVLDKFRTQIPHEKKLEGNVVPAKIADGEYVFPAAFVTALGRGDNKRGAKILDGLRESLREHKRSAPMDKIPPKAKAPLSYISKAKG